MAVERTRVEDLGEFLRQQRHSAQLSLRQLATRAGVSNPYLSQVERGLRRPSAEVLQQLAKALQISATALYTRAGLLEDAGSEPSAAPAGGLAAGRTGVVAAIRADPLLDDRQRRALIDTYAAFVAAGTSRRDVPDHSEPGRQHS
jgi:transcriptional regulator with XRE-family HTH domain